MVIETKVLTVFGLKITATGIPKKVVHYMATLPQCSSVLQLRIPRTLWKRPINVSFEMRKNHNMIGMMMIILNGLPIFFNKYRGFIVAWRIPMSWRVQLTCVISNLHGTGEKIPDRKWWKYTKQVYIRWCFKPLIYQGLIYTSVKNILTPRLLESSCIDKWPRMYIYV